MAALTYEEIEAAAERIGDRVRRVVVAKADPGVVSAADAAGRGEVYLALEFMQHTGTFKARGQLNLLRAQLEVGTLPDAGVTIASGGNAGLACAWAAQDQGVPATVFVPATAPQVKIAGLKRYGADVRLVGSQYAEALTACQDFATTTGALTSHAYDHPLVAAGAGTLLDEIRNQISRPEYRGGGRGRRRPVRWSRHRRPAPRHPNRCRRAGEQPGFERCP